MLAMIKTEAYMVKWNNQLIVMAKECIGGNDFGVVTFSRQNPNNADPCVCAGFLRSKK